MVTFGTVDGEDDDFLDQQQPADQGDDFISDDDDFLHQQPGQGDDDDFMSDSDGYRSAQGDDDFMSDDVNYRSAQGDDDDDFMSDDEDEDEDFDEQPDQVHLFTVLLTGPIRSYTRRVGFTHEPNGAYSEHHDVVLVLAGDDDDDEEEEEYPFPVHAPTAAASEAAIAALEAAEAPADDCCPVCLQLQDGEAPADAWPWRRVAPCGHRFHAACVEKWLRVKLTCPVCRCPAAAAAAYLRHAAPEPTPPPPPPRPIPDIVEEFLAMGYEQSLVFEKCSRWTEFMADPYGHFTSNSSRVSLAVAA